MTLRVLRDLEALREAVFGPAETRSPQPRPTNDFIGAVKRA